MARKKPSFSTVVALMSDNAQARLDTEGQETTDRLPLNAILPDFSQPRRLLPNELIEAVSLGEKTPAEALTDWSEQISSEAGSATAKRSFQELKRLAESIEQHGLINPISVRGVKPQDVVPASVTHLVVTGERRFWAHVYLAINNKQIHEGGVISAADQIKVTITADGVSIKAHQLIENLLRENINAIERADGFWALRYELSGVNYSSPDQPGAEVNYSSPELVPWTRVEEALGISKRYRIFVTSVLNLSNEAQDLVRNHDLSEMTIRPIVQKLRDRPDLQLVALNQLVTWQAENLAEDGPGRPIVASVKALVDELLAEQTEATTDQKETAPRRTRAVSSEPVIRFRDKVRQTLDFLNRLKNQDRNNLNHALAREEFADVMIDLRNLRNQIDDILEKTAEVHPPAESPLAIPNDQD